jgi:hypothetical protein
MTTRCSLALVAGVSVAACGSSAGGPGMAQPGSTSVAGTVGRLTASMQDATALVGSLTVGGGSVPEADVILTNFVGTCAALEQRGNQASSATLVIAVAAQSAVGPGTYAVTATGAIRVAYQAQDANCVTTISETAQSGMVTYDMVDSSRIVGSVDATFPAGDHFSGNFTAPVCNFSLNSLVNPGSGSTAACGHPG